MGALLHDIGKVLIQRWRPEGYREAIRLSHAKNIPLHIAETMELGFSHPLAVEILLSRWRMPGSLILLLKECHDPAPGNRFLESSVISLAEHVARYLDIGADGIRWTLEIDPAIRNSLGIEARTIVEFVDSGFRDFVERSVGSFLAKSAF